MQTITYLFIVHLRRPHESLIDLSDGRCFMDQKGLTLGTATLHSVLMTGVLAVFIG